MKIRQSFRRRATRVESWMLILLQSIVWFVPWTISAAPARHVSGSEVAPGVFALGTIQNPEIRESSGMIASHRHRGVFWTHNDSGHAAVLYAITRTGESVAQFPVTGATLQDWEDIDLDNAGNLYLADVGNNDRDRDEVAVYRVREPDLRHTNAVAINKTWKLRFPERPFDCESFFVSGGYGYLISKNLEDEGAPIYRFPLLVKPQDSIVLEKYGILPVDAAPTGADLSVNRHRLTVITSAGAYVFWARGNILTADNYTMYFAPFEHALMEGVAFTGDGLVVSAETGDLFLFNAEPFQIR